MNSSQTSSCVTRHHDARPLIAVFACYLILGTAGCTQLSKLPIPMPFSKGSRHALLIGIGKYKSREVSSLAGATNDVASMRALLMSRYAFPANSITVLTDSQATRAKVLASLRELVESSEPDDVVYIHFSGHGARVKDLNGDENDGWDETLVPYDGRMPGVADVVDDELDAILSQLKSRWAVVVLDSCHSGTATRGGRFSTRAIAADKRTELYTSKGLVVAPKGAEYLVLAGAAAHQQALDGPVGPAARDYGLFTYSLYRSLALSDDRASPRQIFERVQQELEVLRGRLNLEDVPDPQLEGSSERVDVPMFPRGETRRGFSLVATNKQVTALIGAVAMGGEPGSFWAIYPPGDTEFAPGHAVATAEVRSVRGADAIVVPSSEIAEGSRAILLTPAPPRRRIEVAFSNIPRRRQDWLTSAIRPQIDYELALVTGSDANPMFEVSCRGGTRSRRTCTITDGGTFKDVATFEASDDRELAKRLAPHLDRWALANELVALENWGSGIKLDVCLANASAEKTSRWWAFHAKPAGCPDSSATAADVEGERRRSIWREGTPRTKHNQLQLELRSSRACYLTIVEIKPDNSFGVLFPDAAQKRDFLPKGRIAADQWVSLPDSLSDRNNAGFRWEIEAPAGTATLKVFCSSDLATTQAIRKKVERMQARVAALSDNSPKPPPRVSSRGITVEAVAEPGQDEVPDWTAAAIAFEVQEPADH